LDYDLKQEIKFFIKKEIDEMENTPKLVMSFINEETFNNSYLLSFEDIKTIIPNGRPDFKGLLLSTSRYTIQVFRNGVIQIQIHCFYEDNFFPLVLKEIIEKSSIFEVVRKIFALKSEKPTLILSCVLDNVLGFSVKNAYWQDSEKPTQQKRYVLDLLTLNEVPKTMTQENLFQVFHVIANIFGHDKWNW